MQDINRSAATLSPDTLISAYAGSLYGGDAERGRRIFFRNQSAQCIRCHSYDDIGGNAGPRLNGVGSKTYPCSRYWNRLINPSARLAPGFGMVTLELKERQNSFGYTVEENNTSLVMKGDKQNEVIPKDQVVKRTNAASSMPEMRYILSKKEIRDLVSFLYQSKEDEK